MIRRFRATVIFLISVLISSCDALQNIQQTQQQQTASNQAAGKAPKRAYTLTLPANSDRILPDGYAQGDILQTDPNPWGIRYKEYVFTEFGITTEYYKKNAPTWDGKTQNLILDIVAPKNDAERKRPCLVFLFGGGFVGKYDDCTQEICKGMAQKGYVVVAADYRVGFKDGVLLSALCYGDFNTGMYPAYVRAVQDGRSVVRYLKANADRLGIDANKIFMSGHSAGALAALGVSLLDNSNVPKQVLDQVGGTLDPMKDNMQYDTKVAGVISMAGAVIDPNLILGKKLATPINFIAGTCDDVIDINAAPPFKCKQQGTYPTMYGANAIYEAAKANNSVHFNLICNGAHGMGSVGYNKLIELISNYTYSILQGNPQTGKEIIQAEKAACNRQDLCK